MCNNIYIDFKKITTKQKIQKNIIDVRFNFLKTIRQ